MADKKRRTARSATTRATSVQPELSQSSIAERAYVRWIARGCPISDGQEDWFAAQAELLAERLRSAPRSASLTCTGELGAAHGVIGAASDFALLLGRRVATCEMAQLLGCTSARAWCCSSG